MHTHIFSKQYRPIYITHVCTFPFILAFLYVTGSEKTTLIALLGKIFFDVERKDYVCATVCTFFEERSTFRCGVITVNAKLFPQHTIAENCI